MRRNLFLLACCQAFAQAGNTAMFASTAVSIIAFYPHRELATLPVTLQHVGVMLSVFPAALLMQRMGRSFGFRVGSVFGMIGGVLLGYGLHTQNFILMCAGGLLLGYAVASLQMYRFAAVELAPPSYTAKAISWVTAGGVVAGIIGPTMVRWTHDLTTPLYLATYGGMIGLHLIVFTIMSFIRFPKVQPGTAPATATTPAAVDLPARPLWQIAAQPRFIIAVTCGMSSFGLMSLIMGASPLAIVNCGLPHTETHLVIFMHVMGMFVPSFFTGHLIGRFGLVNVMLAGIAVFVISIVAALLGLSEWHFRIALTLNGVGWNFLFIAATTLVTTTYRSSEKGKVQALNDFLVFGTTATASFLAGLLQERIGWFPMNWWSLVMLVAPSVAVFWLWLKWQPDARPA
jgi:predicted MFS family arabinose efflux permease